MLLFKQLSLQQKGKRSTNSKVVKAQKNDATCRKTTNSIVNINRSPLKYFQVSEEWRCNACSKLKLSFRKMDRVSPGSPNTPLGPPNPYNIKRIQGDGNCLFRSFSYVLTGVENQHMKIRETIISNMYTIGHLLIGPHITETSVNVKRQWMKIAALKGNYEEKKEHVNIYCRDKYALK